MLVLIRKNRYYPIIPKIFFDPELFRFSQLYKLTRKRVQACKKTRILNFYFNNCLYTGQNYCNKNNIIESAQQNSYKTIYIIIFAKCNLYSAISQKNRYYTLVKFNFYNTIKTGHYLRYYSQNSPVRPLQSRNIRYSSQ